MPFYPRRRERQQTKPTKTMNTINHIEAAIMFVRACGPSTKAGIENEIRQQVSSANKDNSGQLTDAAIKHGLEAGWLDHYDDESYCIA